MLCFLNVRASYKKYGCTKFTHIVITNTIIFQLWAISVFTMRYLTTFIWFKDSAMWNQNIFIWLSVSTMWYLTTFIWLRVSVFGIGVLSVNLVFLLFRIWRFFIWLSVSTTAYRCIFIRLNISAMRARRIFIWRRLQCFRYVGWEDFHLPRCFGYFMWFIVSFMSYQTVFIWLNVLVFFWTF